MEILLEELTQSRASGVLCNPPGLDLVMEILLEGLTRSRASGVLYNPLGSLWRSSWRGYPDLGHQECYITLLARYGDPPRGVIPV